MHTDEELIAAHLAGDEAALSTLIDRHLSSVYSFARRLAGDQEAAEDIAQESWLKAWTHLSRFSPQKSSFKTWLMRIVRNTAIDYLRKKKSIPFSVFQHEEGNDPFESIPDEQLLDEMIADQHDKQTLENAILQLPLIYREVLILSFAEGCTLGEIAEMLDCSINTIKTRYRRGIALLRERMHPPA